MKLKRKITNFLIVGSKDKFTLDYIYFNTLKHLGYEVDFLNIEKSINHRIVAGIKKYFSGINHSILRKKIINSFFFKKKNIL